MAVKTKMPKSRAKTAYGLLGEVAALILAEPKRYDQRDVLTFKTGDHETYFPACGTIGCVAGWTVALKASAPKVVAGNGNVLGTARKILGLTEGQEYELFVDSAVGGKSQGLTHARNGARHISQFQKKYRAQLLAKKV